MKTSKLFVLALAFAASAFAAVAPGGKLGIAVNPSGALSFLRVNSSGALLLAAIGPGTSPVPPGQTGVALDPDGNVAFLHVDASGGLIVSGGAVAGPIVDSGLTMTTARMLGRTTAGTGAIEEMTAATVKTFLSLGNVENTALSTWAGSTNITTLGTIATGTWNATAIADGKIASALTGKTYNGLTVTSSTGTLTIAALKTFTASNTLTLTATDGSTLAVGAGGTLGTAAFTAATAYVPAYSGLTTNGILQATGATTVASTLTPAGLTSIGTSAVTSATTNLTLSAVTTVLIGNSMTVQGSVLTINDTTITRAGAGNLIVSGATTAELDIKSTASATNSARVIQQYIGSTSVGYDISYNVDLASENFTIRRLAPSATNIFVLTTGGNLTTTGSIQTGTPTGGVAAAWKHGAARTGVALTTSTTTGVQVDVGGTLYTLATLTTNP